MKRFLAFLLAAGLVLAICMPAAAVDVKFSGQWRAEGWYETNPKLNDQTGQKNSVGFMDSSLLLTAQFKVAEGLALTTRARVLDKIWGDRQGNIQTSTNGGSMDTQNRITATDRLLRENIEFDQMFLDAVLGPGLLRVGFSSGAFGTDFANTDKPGPGISYIYRGLKGWTLIGTFAKGHEGEVHQPASSGALIVNASDNDSNTLAATAIYSAPTWDAGLSYAYIANHGGSLSGSGLYSVPVTANFTSVGGYGRGTFGPIFGEAELAYMWGDYQDARQGGNYALPYYNANGTTAAKAWNMKSLAAYAHGRYTAGPAYLGAKFAYVQGDDPDTFDTNEAGFLGSGREFKPCLILLNSDRDKWLGALGTLSQLSVTPNLVDIVTGNSNYMNAYGGNGSANFWMYQGYVGFKPIAKLDLSASFTYVTLDKKPKVASGAVYVDDKVGTEFDATATYKIYDNLSYMIGFGYLWTGDAWKGADANKTIANDWLLMHKLTLNF